MEDDDDSCVVRLAVGLQQRDQYGILAAFLVAVLVELHQEVFVLFLGGGFVILVFHLEHDRDDFVAVVILVAENIVAFAAAANAVVFFEVGSREGRSANAIEFDFAVLLQAGLKRPIKNSNQQPRQNTTAAHELKNSRIQELN